jgi:putative MATE family efflux protein
VAFGPSRAAGQSNDLINGSIPRAVIRIALPTWGAFLTHDLLGVVDMFFVGKLGPAAVAAVAMSGLIFGIIIMMSQGVGAGTTALVANALGSGNRSKAEAYAAQSLVLAGILSIFVAVIGLLFADLLMKWLGAAEDVAKLGSAYLRIVAGGSFTMMLTMTFGASLRAAGDAGTPFRAMIIANVVNAILDPIFIFGYLGMPALGVPGSAWATLISRAIGLTILVRVFFGGRHEHFQLRLSHLKLEMDTVRRIGRIGVFASGRMFLQNIAQLFLMRLVAMFGTIPVAGFGIGLRLQMFVFGPSMGFGTAAGTMTGQNLGAGKPDRAARATWFAVSIAGGIALVLSVIYWFAGPQLTRIFNEDPRVVEAGAVFLKWYGVSLLFMAVTFVLGFAMMGAGDTLTPMIIVAVTLVLLGVPLAYLLAYFFNDVRGIWAALVFSNVLSGLATMAAFKWGRWRKVGERIRHITTGGEA